MPAIRQEGPINENCYLIDAVHDGMQRAYAAYLVKSRDGQSCLIDAGSKESIKVIYERLQEWGAWPLDKLIITHSHWDHSQGVGFLREKAAEINHTIEVMASEKAIPYLADQSYNICFDLDQAPFLNVHDVIGLKDGDRIDLGAGTILRIIDTPGHMVDHISVLEESSGIAFTGDAIGMKYTDNFNVPNPNSEFWDEAAFYQSIDTLKSIGIKGLGLGHFGCLLGDEAQIFLDETVQMYNRWMEIFKQNRDKLDDIPELVQILIREVYTHLPQEMHQIASEALVGAVGLAAGAYQDKD